MTDREQPKQDTDLFSEMGAEGEKYRESIKAEPSGPNITDKARAKIDEHNEKQTDEAKKVSIEKVAGSGTGGQITVSDAIKAINAATAPPKPTAARGGAVAAAGVKKEPDAYPEGTQISYVGRRFDLPRLDMKLEDMREWMYAEQDFRELSKERAEMIYDEQLGLVIPVLKAGKKGLAEMIDDKRLPDKLVAFKRISKHLLEYPVFNVIGDDGVYQIRTTQSGVFAVKLPPKWKIKEGFALKTPRVPSELLKIIVKEFKANSHKEVICNIFYNAAYAGWYLDWPEQNGTAGSVEYGGSIESENQFIVLQIHSHGNMPAFFSGTDDRDEVRTGLYGVIGRLNSDEDIKPTMKLRYSCGGEYRTASPWDVFDSNWTWHCRWETGDEE